IQAVRLTLRFPSVSVVSVADHPYIIVHTEGWLQSPSGPGLSPERCLWRENV
ncbi:hypothetical protein OF83DRAFT_1157293, partial [Amylostereum chailletii]